MAQITSQVVRQLFEETELKTWPGFRRTLNKHKQGQLQGIDQSVIDELLRVTQHMEERLETFPISAENLERAIERERHPMPT